MVENRLKRALIAKVTGIKMPEKRHPLLLAYSRVHVAILRKEIVYDASLKLDFSAAADRPGTFAGEPACA
jgi:hypothetical protein